MLYVSPINTVKCVIYYYVLSIVFYYYYHSWYRGVNLKSIVYMNLQSQSPFARRVRHVKVMCINGD